MPDQPRLCSVANLRIGPSHPLVIIAGPCVLESYELGIAIGTRLKALCQPLGLPYIFKASFDKANRSSIDSPRGPGMTQGLEWLARIGRELGVPVTTDIHEHTQAEPAAKHVDLIQIPAFLCRQTDLLVAAGRAAAAHHRAVNVKKGQFISPDEMRGPVKKLAQTGCTNIMLTERGTFFGYGRLVNDFLGVAELMEHQHQGGPVPVCFDCTHSTQQPGKGEGGKVTGGRADLAPMLARAATAAGVHALFIECHPDPKSALSDAATMIKLEDMPAVLRDVAAIRSALTPH
ncbi:MAG: 3-deoxy-8-phosphooctulonate synthase [Phycisphaerales bacterium]|nr:3-deoxy-8-phosphooctulonate synthase [Phycisphaerales bacterium]